MTECIITVTYANGTHTAVCRGTKVRASATSDYEEAARRCARKAMEGRPFRLRRYGKSYTWIVEAA